MELEQKPDDEILAAGLGVDAILQRSVLAAANGDRELVACRMPDGSLRQLFCKFGPLDEAQPATHRFGVAYEVQVYDQLLSAWQDDVPPLHGVFLDESARTICLALDYLEGATPLGQVPDPKAGLLEAARGVARFHRWSETVAVPSFLQRYDTDFYRLSMQRAGQFAGRLHERYPWLPELCERCQRRLPALLPPATIIHGSYHAGNILVDDGSNVVANWDSAALAAGEIDVGSLTWGSTADVASLCEQEYCLARWPDGTPDDFALRLAAARVFLHLRRLGELDGEEGLESMIPVLAELQPLAERLRELGS